jgi:hypothetical protein
VQETLEHSPNAHAGEDVSVSQIATLHAPTEVPAAINALVACCTSKNITRSARPNSSEYCVLAVLNIVCLLSTHIAQIMLPCFARKTCLDAAHPRPPLGVHGDPLADETFKCPLSAREKVVRPYHRRAIPNTMHVAVPRLAW